MEMNRMSRHSDHDNSTRTTSWYELLGIRSGNRLSYTPSRLLATTKPHLLHNELSLSLLNDDVKRASSAFSGLRQFHCDKGKNLNNEQTSTESVRYLQECIIQSITDVCVLHQIEYSQGMLHISLMLSYLIPCPLTNRDLFTQMLDRFLLLTCPQLFLSDSSSRDPCHRQKQLCLLFHQLFQFHFPSVSFHVDRFYLTSYWNVEWFDSLCSTTKFRRPMSWLKFWYFILQITSGKREYEGKRSHIDYPIRSSLESESYSSHLLYPSDISEHGKIKEETSQDYTHRTNNHHSLPSLSNPSVHVSSNDVIASVYPEYMTALVAIIKKLQRELMNQNSVKQNKNVENNKAENNKAENNKAENNSVGLSVATELQSYAECSQWASWDWLLHDVTPTTREELTQSQTEKTEDMRNEEADNEEIYWMSDLKQLYNEVVVNTPKAWFELVNKVLNKWDTENKEVIVGDSQRDVRGELIESQCQRYSLTITVKQLVEWITMIDNNLGFKETSRESNIRDKIPDMKLVDEQAAENQELNCFGNDGNIKDQETDDKLGMKTKEVMGKQERPGEKLFSSGMPESRPKKILLVIPVSNTKNPIHEKTSKFLNHVMANENGKKILKSLTAKLDTTSNVIALFVISSDNQIPNGLETLIETEDSSIMNDQCFIPMIESLYQEYILSSVVIIDEIGINNDVSVVDGVIQYDPLKNSIHSNRSLQLSWICLSHGISHVVAVVPDFPSLLLSLLGGVESSVSDTKSFHPNQWRRKRRARSKLNRTPPIGIEDGNNKEQQSIKSRIDACGSIWLPMKYVRRVPIKGQQYKSINPTDEHLKKPSRPWEWILALLSPGVPAPTVISNNTLESSSSRSLPDSCFPKDVHVTRSLRWRRRISSKVSRLSSLSSDKLRFQKRTIRRNRTNTSGICPRPTIAIQNYTLTKPQSTVEHGYLESLKLNYSCYNEMKQKQWIQQIQKDALKTIQSDNSPLSRSEINQINNSNAEISLDENKVLV